MAKRVTKKKSGKTAGPNKAGKTVSSKPKATTKMIAMRYMSALCLEC